MELLDNKKVYGRPAAVQNQNQTYSVDGVLGVTSSHTSSLTRLKAVYSRLTGRLLLRRSVVMEFEAKIQPTQHQATLPFT